MCAERLNVIWESPAVWETGKEDPDPRLGHCPVVGPRLDLLGYRKDMTEVVRCVTR